MSKYRIVVLNPYTDGSYIVRGEDGHVTYMSADLAPLSLANMSPQAALLRFRLEDAEDAEAALAAVRTLAYKGYTAEIYKS